MPSTSVMANIQQYNYDTTLTTKQVGVDINAVIKCGYEYGNNTDCEKSNSTTSSGYQKNASAVSGTNDARNLNKGNGLQTPQYNQKQIGFGSIDTPPSNMNYGNTRDIQKQQQLLSETYGETSTQTKGQDLRSLGIYGLDDSGVNTASSNTGNLTQTYNTNKLSTEEGFALKNKCLIVNPNRPVGVGPQDDRYYLYNDVQCLSVRTVALSQDTGAETGMTLKDPLNDLAKNAAKTNNKTNNKVINVNTTASNASTANQQSYACEIKPERRVNMSYSCNTFPTGRQQVCKQERKVMCGASGVNLVKNNSASRPLPECIPAIDKSSIKLDLNGSTRTARSFQVTDTGFSMSERWEESSRTTSTNTWLFTFNVNDRSKAYLNLYRIHYDNVMTIQYNGVTIANYSTASNATRILNYDLRSLTVNGLNTMLVTLRNNGGPAAADFNVIADPIAFKSCDCQEAWVTTCSTDNVELRQ